MNNANYQQRSLLLLFPLGLLAIASFALDKRIPIGIDFTIQNILLEICRTMIPGLFAITVACLIPTFNRFYQLFAVGLNYSLLCGISITFYPHLFTQPTAWVIASLAATMFLLPSNDLDQEAERASIGATLIKVLGVLFVPALVLLSFVVIIKNIEHSILITFTTVFVDSFLSCLFVPIYEIMLTLGFSSLLNSLVSLQTESETIHAMLNSILLTNLFVLPTLIMVRAYLAKSYNRLFLVFLAMITCLTSKIGSCISVELSILMFFYPGTLIVLCISSVMLFFLSLYLDLSNFTNFFMLYQPDLVLKNLAFFQLSTSHYALMLTAVIVPAIIQVILSKIGTVNYLKNKFKKRSITGGLSIDEIDNPELLLIAILKNIGGKSNIEAVSKLGNELIIKVFNYKLISSRELGKLGSKKVLFIRSINKIKLDLGSMTNVIYTRLHNIVSDSANYNQNEVSLSEPFNFEGYIKAQEGDKK